MSVGTCLARYFMLYAAAVSTKAGGQSLSMSLPEKIGQLLQIRVYGDAVDAPGLEYEKVKALIEQEHIGSVDLRVRLDGPNLLRPKPERIALTLNGLQVRSKIPLLVGADIERGLIARSSGVPDMPNVMAWGAAGDLRAVRLVAKILAEEARAVGIQWAFAPVADINSDPKNPIIGDRSFGDDADLTGDFVAAFIEGAHAGGLLTTAKHFPGHGDTETDSHLGVVTLGQDRSHLERIEFSPFRKAIAAGTDAVMLAHARVPSLDADPARIATNSTKIVGGSLRGTLGFHGVVITDSMEMRGVTDLYRSDPDPVGRAAIEAIKAGVDILMVPEHVEVVAKALLAAVNRGEISEARIDESVRRVLALKEKAGLLRQKLVDVTKVQDVLARPADWNLAQIAADSAVSLVKNDGFQLPLPVHAKKEAEGGGEGRKRTVLLIFSDSFRSPLGKAFEKTFEERDAQVQVRHIYYDNRAAWEMGDVLDVTRNASRVVMAVFMTNLPGRKDAAHGKIVDVVGLNGQSARLFSQILDIVGNRAMVVSLGSPYLILTYPDIKNYICTFSISSTSEIAAVKAMFGEIHNKARLPVSLPGVAQRGSFMEWPGRTGSPHRGHERNIP